jgi:signal transduction histidine kinase
MHPLIRRQPHADVAMAVVVCTVTLITTAADRQRGGVDLTAAVEAGLAGAALVARRRFPVVALAVTVCAAEAYLVHYAGNQGAAVLAAPLIALYHLAEADGRRRALTIGVLGVLAMAGLHMLIKPASLLGADNAALAALGGLAVTAGNASRNRRAYLAEVEARARDVEADREAEAARRVTEERLRIARDLHDAVGHQLALINVQAGVAAHVLASQPDETLAALSLIRQASRAALGELRDTVGLLRRADEPVAPTEPVPGLAGLPELLDTFRRAGLVVRERIDGRVAAVPVAVDLTAFRVIQESLTNVCKHAAGATATLRLGYQPDELTVIVENGAPPAGGADSTAGHGLVGMRERVAAIGGDLRYGRRPDGGYRVTATLPLPVPSGAPVPVSLAGGAA